MCKEHLGVALALKVPVFFVVTKVDICPGHVLQHSLATLSSILRKPGIKKKPYMVTSVLLGWHCPALDTSASMGKAIMIFGCLFRPKWRLSWSICCRLGARRMS